MAFVESDDGGDMGEIAWFKDPLSDLSDAWYANEVWVRRTFTWRDDVDRTSEPWELPSGYDIRIKEGVSTSFEISLKSVLDSAPEGLDSLVAYIEELASNQSDDRFFNGSAFGVRVLQSQGSSCRI